MLDGSDYQIKSHESKVHHKYVALQWRSKACHILFQFVTGICDHSIITLPLFVAIQLADALLCSGTLLCTVYIIPHTKEMDIPENDVAMLVTVVSGVDILEGFVLL